MQYAAKYQINIYAFLGNEYACQEVLCKVQII